MSLLTEAYEPFKFVNKTRISDGAGGFITTWTESEETFDAAIDVPASTLATIANKMTERRNATLTTSKAITLDVMDVIRRVEDGQYFRVTSSGKDNKTPASATLDMRQSTVEFWALPASDE